MFNYHHYHVRKNVIYDNPFFSDFGMNVGIFNTSIVKKIIESKEYKIYTGNSTEQNIELEKFAFGCGWDHRAAVYIGILHAGYMFPLKNEHLYGLPEDWKEIIAKKIMLPFILMREHGVLNSEIAKEY